MGGNGLRRTSASVILAPSDGAGTVETPAPAERPSPSAPAWAASAAGGVLCLSILATPASTVGRPAYPQVRQTLAAGRRGRRAHDLLVRDVAQVLGEPPAVTEGVGELSMAVAPELIPQRVQHLGTRVHRAPPERIHVLAGEVQHG